MVCIIRSQAMGQPAPTEAKGEACSCSRWYVPVSLFKPTPLTLPFAPIIPLRLPRRFLRVYLHSNKPVSTSTRSSSASRPDARRIPTTEQDSLLTKPPTRCTPRSAHGAFRTVSWSVRSAYDSDKEGHCVCGVCGRDDSRRCQGCTAQLQARWGGKDQGQYLSFPQRPVVCNRYVQALTVRFCTDHVCKKVIYVCAHSNTGSLDWLTCSGYTIVNLVPYGIHVFWRSDTNIKQVFCPGLLPCSATVQYLLISINLNNLNVTSYIALYTRALSAY